MKIINLTPHTVTIVLDEDETVIFPASGEIARVAQEEELVTIWKDIPTVKLTFGEVENLPNPEEGSFYIVSSIVKAACPNRTDLLVPTRLVRDGSGRVIGCGAFSI